MLTLVLRPLWGVVKSLKGTPLRLHRMVLTVCGVAAIAALFAIPVPDTVHVEGRVVRYELQVIRIEDEGRLISTNGTSSRAGTVAEFANPALTAERHSDLRYGGGGGYAFAHQINAVPLLAEEFGLAQAHFPILFPVAAPYLPLALLGARQGQNDFVDADGRWRQGVYVPAYLRRHPFMLASAQGQNARRLLCADLTAEGFGATVGAGLLFDDQGGATPLATKILDFCQRYDVAEQRTRATVRQLADLDVLEPGAISVNRSGETLRVDGFQVISQKRLNTLDDKVLAGFIRRGVTPLIAAHLFSTTQFSDLFRESTA